MKKQKKTIRKKLKQIKEDSGYYWLDDYLAHLRVLLEAEDKIMQRAAIFPAMHYIQDAIKATMEAIKEEVIKQSGLSEEIKRLFANSSTNHAWDWNKEFLEWRKERGGNINWKRKENL